MHARISRYPSSPALLMQAAFLALLLAGCATTAGTAANSLTPTSTPPTATPQPFASPTTAGDQRCDPAQTRGAIRMGDLAIGRSEVLYGFNADYMLPDGLPAKPLSVTLRNNEVVVLGTDIQSRIVVRPVAFLIGICNTSSTRGHRLTAFGAKLTSLVPYAGRLNSLNACASLYS